MDRYAGIPQNRLPKKWFNFYVVYKYSWCTSTYIVGLDTDETADKFLKEILAHKEICRAEVFGHYPRELLEKHEDNI